VIDEHSIPQRWKDVLKALQENGFPEAIIAGGALRDLDHGREIKDVDIFVLDHGASSAVLAKDLARAIGYRATNIIAPANSEYAIGRRERPVTGIYEFEHENKMYSNGIPFQIIAVQSVSGLKDFPAYVLQDFDLGICRIYFDGKTLVRAPEYTQDEITKTFTAYVPLSGRQLDLTKERVRRLSEKYPEFTSNLHYQEAA
jgi:hypothetical protein